MWSPTKKLKSPGQYELSTVETTVTDASTRVSLLELQDELFALSGRIGSTCADLLNRVFSLHLIGCLLRVTKKERKSAQKRLRYYVS